MARFTGASPLSKKQNRCAYCKQLKYFDPKLEQSCRDCFNLTFQNYFTNFVLPPKAWLEVSS
jgi:hypothetical protein